MKYQLKVIARGMYRTTDKIVLRKVVCLLYGNYPEFRSTPTLLRFAFLQKILGFNRSVPWPVHFTSKVVGWANIERGARVYPGASPGCYIQARNGIMFGSNVRIGPNVCVVSSDHAADDYDIHVRQSPVEIGSNVWIGANSVILPGVKIGSNVIIGAGSIVSSDIPGNSVAAGNPCHVIKAKPPYTGKKYV